MDLLKMIRMVLWSFFGVRSRASQEEDFLNTKFGYLPLTAVLLAASIGAVLVGVVLMISGGSPIHAQGF